MYGTHINLIKTLHQDQLETDLVSLGLARVTAAKTRLRGPGASFSFRFRSSRTEVRSGPVLTPPRARSSSRGYRSEAGDWEQDDEGPASERAMPTAVRESTPLKGQQSWVAFVRHAKAPELPVVLLEDVAALTGLALALIGVGMAAITGNGRWDGIGTCAIGLLLIAVAIILVIETKSLLLGESASAPTRVAIAQALVGEDVNRVIHLRTLHLGPDEILVAAKIAVPQTTTAAEVAAAIDAAEARVRERVPLARVIYLEPDIDRDQDTAGTGPT
jgi:hypothetical protein